MNGAPFLPTKVQHVVVPTTARSLTGTCFPLLKRIFRFKDTPTLISNSGELFGFWTEVVLGPDTQKGNCWILPRTIEVRIILEEMKATGNIHTEKQRIKDLFSTTTTSVVLLFKWAHYGNCGDKERVFRQVLHYPIFKICKFPATTSTSESTTKSSRSTKTSSCSSTSSTAPEATDSSTSSSEAPTATVWTQRNSECLCI